MKKIIGGIALFIVVSFVIASCTSTETYADKLKKEEKAIKRIIGDSNIVVLTTYPEVFKDNEYFFDSKSGVYFNVVDSGNGRRASSALKTDVYIRYKSAYRPLYTDTVIYSNLGNGSSLDYINLTYGLSTTYTSSTTSDGYSNYMFKSIGLTIPLKYVGEGAIVKLIVPFGSGSAMQQYYYEPVYFGYVKYDFEDEQE